VSPLASSLPPEPLDSAQLRRRCESAERALRQGGRDRRAIDACFAALVDGAEGRILASVYVKEHDRLWLIAQRGYAEVLDGFSLQRGVMARAVRTGETQFVPDARAEPDFLEATAGILAEVTVPFGPRSGSSVEGALNIETAGATLPPEAPEIFEPLARTLGERIAEMRESLDVDVATLVRLCVHASSLRESGQIAEFAARTVGRLLELDCVQLDLRSRSGTFRHASFWRREESGLEPLASAAIEELALLEDETGVDAAYHLFDIRLTEVADEHLAAPWSVWFPLTVAGGSVGAIVGRAASRPAFEYERAEGATLFAQHVAALLDVSLALRRQRHAAVTDALTGLLNRRGFDERLTEELERALRTDGRVALVLADCDDLKGINDRGGHELGDRVLDAFARCLESCTRAEDAAARIGGDEFAIVMPGASSDAARATAKRLRRELRTLSFDDVTRVEAAFGVAAFPDDGTTCADLVRAADRALYAAKQESKAPADAA
jgi:diguanylate cyclase (GGDEF)-like protein